MDASIVNLNAEVSINTANITQLDASIVDINAYQLIQDITISLNSDNIIQLDASIVNLNAAVSINAANIVQLDASIVRIDNYNSIQDASIIAIEASLGDYVKKAGDTMTGDLIIETDLSVNGKGFFAQFNVSGLVFPADPSSGDKFYRTDLELDFAYDSGRGKWLSVSKAMYNCGNNRVNGNVTAYMNIGGAFMSSTRGIRMIRNGTVTAISIDNQNNVTAAAGRDIEIRINDVSTEILTILQNDKGAYTNQVNLDFDINNLIQAVLIANNSDRLDDVLVSFEVTWRA